MLDVSIIIPSRSPQFLQKTVNDFLTHSETKIEIIAVMDGIWSDPPLKDDPRVIILHHGTVHNNPGMRESINRGIAISKGKFICKVDEHVSVSQGWDKVLIADCGNNDVIIPRRGRLDAENWIEIKDDRPYIDYMYIEFPFAKPFDSTQGLHGAEWREKFDERQDVLVDETPTGQGSFYFMPRKHWDNVIKELSTEKFGPFTQEAQEITLTTWLSGGRVLVNKKATYLHWHKGKRGKGYNFTNEQYEVFMGNKEKGRQFSVDYWLNTKDFKYDWDWFMRKFPNMPGWETNWKQQIERLKHTDFRYSPDFRTWKAEDYAKKQA